MDCSPPGSSCPWAFSGKNPGVVCHFLLQGIFLTQGLNPGLLHCRQTLYCVRAATAFCSCSLDRGSVTKLHFYLMHMWMGSVGSLSLKKKKKKRILWRCPKSHRWKESCSVCGRGWGECDPTPSCLLYCTDKITRELNSANHSLPLLADWLLKGCCCR